MNSAVKLFFQVPVFVRIVFLKIGVIDTIHDRYNRQKFLIQTKWREPTLDGRKRVSISSGVIIREMNSHERSFYLIQSYRGHIPLTRFRYHMDHKICFTNLAFNRQTNHSCNLIFSIAFVPSRALLIATQFVEGHLVIQPQ